VYPVLSENLQWELIQVDNFLENQARYRAFYIAIHQSKFFSKSKKEMLKNI
jgi:hypothetical protein